MNGNDISVKTPLRMVARSQTRMMEEDCQDGLSTRLDP
jgi:hypothetical protein